MCRGPRLSRGRVRQSSESRVCVRQNWTSVCRVDSAKNPAGPIDTTAECAETSASMVGEGVNVVASC